MLELTYMHDETWEDYYGFRSPPVLMVCDDLTLQRRVQRYLRRIFYSTYEDDVFLVTSRQLLAGAEGDDEIWIRVTDEAVETIKLSDIFDYGDDIQE